VLDEPDANGLVTISMVSDTSLGSQSFKIDSTPTFYIHLNHQTSVASHLLAITDVRLTEQQIEWVLRQDVLMRVNRYAENKYMPKEFVANADSVPVSGKLLGAPELENLVDASLDGWLTTGRYNDLFEKRLAEYIGVKHVLTVNSGSSANLVALSALTSSKLGERALQEGDEVITVAAGFPTTVNPILQNNLVPVFVDISLPTYNIDVSQLAAALSDKTKAIMMAHTLGNAFNIDEVVRFARAHNLWIIEDCCDALGTTYTPTKQLQDYRGKDIATGQARHLGTFGDVATLSFYPAHHITMGEGGAIFTNNGKLKILLESFRDWGRDCFCPPGQDNTCKKRFCQKLGELPEGYDHKYTYSHVGYNLKITDMQAAVALAQMERLDDFVAARQRNFDLLYEGLSGLTDYLVLPKAEDHTRVSWFGFPISLKQHARNDFIAHLERHKIASRLLFAGNLTKQPYFKQQTYRVVGELTNTDFVMNNTLWIGVFPVITDEMIEHMIATVTAFFGDENDKK
jgi:CDP-6-deoxy-D-xylo-4-hexulose-3-dehydrase